MWLNVRNKPNGKDYLLRDHRAMGIPKLTDAENLQKAVDAVIEDIHDLEPYSKQQPHMSSTLSKYLSCIKIMESQKQIIRLD